MIHICSTKTFKIIMFGVIFNTGIVLPKKKKNTTIEDRPVMDPYEKIPNVLREYQKSCLAEALASSNILFFLKKIGNMPWTCNLMFGSKITMLFALRFSPFLDKRWGNFIKANVWIQQTTSMKQMFPKTISK